MDALFSMMTMERGQHSLLPQMVFKALVIFSCCYFPINTFILLL